MPIAVKERDVIDVGGAEVSLERVKNHAEVPDPLALGLYPIDIDIKLWLNCAERSKQARKTRLGIPLIDDVSDGAFERTNPKAAPILNLHLEAAGAAQAVNWRSTEDGDRGLFDLQELRLQALTMMASPLKLALPARSSKGLRIRNKPAAFEMLVLVRTEYPGSPMM